MTANYRNRLGPRRRGLVLRPVTRDPFLGRDTSGAYFIVPHQSPQSTGRMDVKDVKMRTDERRNGPPDGSPAADYVERGTIPYRRRIERYCSQGPTASVY